MATIIRNTTQSDRSSNNFLLGIVLLLVVVVLFFIYGLPYMGSVLRNTTPQVNIPGKVDINVHGGSGTNGTNSTGNTGK